MEKKEEQPRISLALGSYEDIFSDFDIRSYSQRALSQDFLEEAERSSKDKEVNNFELDIQIPKKKRKAEDEKIIEKRLKEHFKKHFHIIQKETNSIKKNGIYFTMGGIIIMFVAAIILFKQKNATLLAKFLIVLLEPAGWFLFWEGLDLVTIEVKKKKHQLDFYRKMSNCSIKFYSY